MDYFAKMTSSDYYRHLAAECLELAKKAPEKNDKARLTQMAQAWVDLADKRQDRTRETDKPDQTGE